MHPGIFALGYTIVANYLSTIALPAHYRAYALLAAPKVIQAGIGALSDWYAWRLSERLFGRNTAAAWSVVSISWSDYSCITNGYAAFDEYCQSVAILLLNSDVFKLS